MTAELADDFEPVRWRKDCNHGFLWPKCLAPVCDNAPGGPGIWELRAPLRELESAPRKAPASNSLEGTTVGRVTVGRRTGTSGPTGSPEHECLCECGATCIKSRTAILVAKNRGARMACCRSCSADRSCDCKRAEALK